MPGWHEATKEQQAAGEIQMVGIIQEQHADRARLFMQWKEMDWPILVDSYNLLEVPYVPITLAIDEHGVIREIHPPLQQVGEFAEGFLSTDYPAPDDGGGSPAPPDVAALHRTAIDAGTAAAWNAYGDAIALWGGAGRHGEAIRAYGNAVEADPTDKYARFRLGVAHRMRYDSPARRPHDFQRAVDHWSRALELDPNQYIFRRRIQQYGPRLDKPYPFYDWVHAARDEIRARGEEPVELVVEPRGSEYAEPTEAFRADAAAAEPDPEGRIHRDKKGFITVEATAVPAAVEPGGVTRLHLVFRPNQAVLAHWNNEIGSLQVWLDPPDGWTADSRLLDYPVPSEPVTLETRALEVELQAPESARPGDVDVTGYALYYVCEDVNGVCMYRRQDLEATVVVRRE